MSDDQEVTELQSRVRELEAELANREASDQIHEVELRSLILDVALKAAYIDKLERVQEEVIAPKDVHIRNLEAMIAQLSAQIESKSAGMPDASAESSLGRIARRLRG